MIKTIVFTGDSHTYGQGAKGLIESFNTPVVAGDLRLAGFQFDSYVNLLRRFINNKTNSTATELSSMQLCNYYQLSYKEGCAEIGNKPVKIDNVAKLFRIQLKACKEPSVAEIEIDGVKKTVNLQKEDCDNAYVNVSLFSISQNGSNVSMRATNGSVLVYRVEAYAGEYAVVNSGIGSCTSERFLNEYWEDYVSVLKPTIVVLEPHSINDWLSLQTPSYCEHKIKEMIYRHQENGSKVILHTVSPILGSQNTPYNPINYSEYVEASRRAAASLNIPLCDANKLMNDYLYSIPKEEYASALFEDYWHVNNMGHSLYSLSLEEQILALIEKKLNKENY